MSSVFLKNTPQILKIQEIRLTTPPICDKMKLTNAGVCEEIPPCRLTSFAGMAELADALDLGSNTFGVQVQVLSPAPNSRRGFPPGF